MNLERGRTERSTGLYRTYLDTPSASVLCPLPWPKARDRSFNELQQGGDNVTSHLDPIIPASLDQGRHEGYFATVRDNADGTYDVSYLAKIAG